MQMQLHYSTKGDVPGIGEIGSCGHYLACYLFDAAFWHLEAALCASHENQPSTLRLSMPQKNLRCPQHLEVQCHIVQHMTDNQYHTCVLIHCLWICAWLTTNTVWQCFNMSVDRLITRHTQKQKHAQYYQLKQYLLADKSWRFWCVMWACLPSRY